MDENMSDENKPEKSDMESQGTKRMRTDPDEVASSNSDQDYQEYGDQFRITAVAGASSAHIPFVEVHPQPPSVPEPELPERNILDSSLSNDDLSSVSIDDNGSNGSDEDMDSDADDIYSLQSGTQSMSDLSAYYDQSDSSNSTVINDTDTASDEAVNELLKKEKPKHNWFVVPEIINRQIGYQTRKSNPSLFQQRCSGSLLNVQKLELMYKLEAHEGCVNSLNFSHNGSLLASGSDDTKAVIWDWKLGKPLIKVDTRHKRNIFQTKFLDLKGPDIHLATCSRDGLVCYNQIANEGIRDSRKLGQHRGPCHKLSVLVDQPHVLLSAGEDGIVFNFDVRRNTPSRLVLVKNDDIEIPLYSIHTHPIKTHEFCVAGRDYMVRTYDQRNCGKSLAEYHPFSSDHPTKRTTRSLLHVTCAVYNHDGNEILASYNEDDVYLFDSNKGPGEYLHKYAGHRNSATIKGVAFFGPKSEFIMSGSDCAHVFFWEKKTEAITQFLLADDNGVVNCLEPHPELPFLATSGLDWDIKLWVPSCEEGPSLNDLAETLKGNKRTTFAYEAGSESQVLWMLWRRLRETRAARRVLEEDGDRGVVTVDSNDSSSNSWISQSDDDDFEDGTNACTTS